MEVAGLAPILWSHGTSADLMKRIATPMIGGLITSTIMVLLVYPAIFYLWRSQHRKRLPPPEPDAALPELPNSGPETGGTAPTHGNPAA